MARAYIKPKARKRAKIKGCFRTHQGAAFLRAVWASPKNHRRGRHPQLILARSSAATRSLGVNATFVATVSAENIASALSYEKLGSSETGKLFVLQVGPWRTSVRKSFLYP